MKGEICWKVVRPAIIPGLKTIALTKRQELELAELEMLGKDGVKGKGKMEEYDLLWCP